MHIARPLTYGPSSSMDWVLAQKVSSMDFIVHGLDMHSDTHLCFLSSIAWMCIMPRPLYKRVCSRLYLLKLWALPPPLIWTRVPSSCFTLMDDYALGSFEVLAQIIGSTSSFDLDEGALILLYP